ncbi:DinF_protein [Hexamita inflata]|uniref:DinF protein n=2 Tax=Hexamita inflata TaxID=28002 RepID=A0AA86P562_9EUKA|nr:DinF protein [Hexamita inflata]
MDLKEPSVHVSQKSRTSTSISNQMFKQHRTLDSIMQKTTTDPVSQLSSAYFWPLIITTAVEVFHQLLVITMTWNYVGRDAVEQMVCAFPVILIITKLIPRAIAQGSIANMIRYLTDNQVKRADEVFTYQILSQVIYFIIAVFIAFIFGLQGLKIFNITGDDYISTYIGVMLSVGTLVEIFGAAQTQFYLFEGDTWMYALSNIATLLLQQSLTLLSIQHILSQQRYLTGVEMTLIPFLIGHIVGALPLVGFNLLRFQDFKATTFSAVIRLKMKYLQVFNLTELLHTIYNGTLRSLEQVIQPIVYFGFQVYNSKFNTHPTDAAVSHIGSHMFIMGMLILQFPTMAFQMVAIYTISSNNLMKKYIRTKELIFRTVIWGLICEAIVAILVSSVDSIITFFLPASKSEEVDFILRFTSEYTDKLNFTGVLTFFYYISVILLNIERKWPIEITGIAFYFVMTLIMFLVMASSNGTGANTAIVSYWCDVTIGIAGFLVLAEKFIEIMQLAKIELRRLKKKKRQEENGIIAEKDDGKGE